MRPFQISGEFEGRNIWVHCCLVGVVSFTFFCSFLDNNSRLNIVGAIYYVLWSEPQAFRTEKVEKPYKISKFCKLFEIKKLILMNWFYNLDVMQLVSYVM